MKRIDHLMDVSASRRPAKRTLVLCPADGDQVRSCIPTTDQRLTAGKDRHFLNQVTMKFRKTDSDIHSALFLTTEQVQRIDGSIERAIDKLQGNDKPDWSVYEIIVLVAPDIHTPEEAFYAGLCCMSWVDILLKKGIIEQP